MKPLTNEEKDLRRLADCLPPEALQRLRDFAEMLLKKLMEQEQEEGHCKT